MKTGEVFQEGTPGYVRVLVDDLHDLATEFRRWVDLVDDRLAKLEQHAGIEPPE